MGFPVAESTRDEWGGLRKHDQRSPQGDWPDALLVESWWGESRWMGGCWPRSELKLEWNGWMLVASDLLESRAPLVASLLLMFPKHAGHTSKNHIWTWPWCLGHIRRYLAVSSEYGPLKCSIKMLNSRRCWVQMFYICHTFDLADLGWGIKHLSSHGFHEPDGGIAVANKFTPWLDRLIPLPFTQFWSVKIHRESIAGEEE